MGPPPQFLQHPMGMPPQPNMMGHPQMLPGGPPGSAPHLQFRPPPNFQPPPMFPQQMQMAAAKSEMINDGQEVGPSGNDQ